MYVLYHSRIDLKSMSYFSHLQYYSCYIYEGAMNFSYTKYIPSLWSWTISSVSKRRSCWYSSSASIWTHVLPTEFSIFFSLYRMAFHNFIESSVSLWIMNPEELELKFLVLNEYVVMKY